MHPVCHRSFGFDLAELDDACVLIPRGTRLPARRQVTLPVEQFYRPYQSAEMRDYVAVHIPIHQGHGARAISLGTLEIVSPLKRPKLCRVVFRLSAGWLLVSVTIGRRSQSVRICVKTGPSRRERKPAWIPVGVLELLQTDERVLPGQAVSRGR